MAKSGRKATRGRPVSDAEVTAGEDLLRVWADVIEVAETLRSRMDDEQGHYFTIEHDARYYLGLANVNADDKARLVRAMNRHLHHGAARTHAEVARSDYRNLMRVCAKALPRLRLDAFLRGAWKIERHHRLEVAQAFMGVLDTLGQDAPATLLKATALAIQAAVPTTSRWARSRRATASTVTVTVEHVECALRAFAGDDNQIDRSPRRAEKLLEHVMKQIEGAESVPAATQRNWRLDRLTKIAPEKR